MLKNLSAAVICGGKSKRFGEPKSLVTFNNRHLVDYAIDLAKQIGQDQFLIYGETNLFNAKDINCIPDFIPNCGPLGGVYTALLTSKGPWTAMIPCDMHFLETKVYEMLFENRVENRAVVALSENGMESLVSIWPSSIKEMVESTIHKKELAIHTLLKKCQAVEISFPETMPNYRFEIFDNVNTKEDLRGIQTRNSNLKK